ncbi:hypothetical protein B0A58_14340 [Flavobacterium branchiophilum NBRC 15030 = ATCC 35035]|uniref:Uncharacterized protein n=2 Tax=Flavobacterium branchiophilum TaxID=55197 RepID=G2Z1G3_FLABF|nr:hypothetical protein [Flavobacterium branchiophilum]OXA70718.1 hypothetical protein B0A58_14340 [Flavobacterium branchiophilum NBRC 15030 = ATCC 35035]PDS25172.1 hypothetical protein B0A77_05715 [Flavobacterium branchiophilum]TQM42180.1 hypothetical protein BC670_3216 [Flavobacterium branchiophilum]CCB69731.1 Hypothetical protein precursor [Flavobacterium branchiophilum FL-15]GEM54524.1 hypothetical protein FB1_07450 [Flavobacterium branchiophilum NBRC 15030 = ATCC 35035]
MKKLISILAVAAFLFSVNINAQETTPKQKEKKECCKGKKSCDKDKKTCSAEEKKSCEKDGKKAGKCCKKM